MTEYVIMRKDKGGGGGDAEATQFAIRQPLSQFK